MLQPLLGEWWLVSWYCASSLWQFGRAFVFAAVVRERSGTKLPAHPQRPLSANPQRPLSARQLHRTSSRVSNHLNTTLFTTPHCRVPTHLTLPPSLNQQPLQWVEHRPPHTPAQEEPPRQATPLNPQTCLHPTLGYLPSLIQND